MKLKKIKLKIDTYLSVQSDKFSEPLVGEVAQNVDLEKWTHGHTYKPRAYGVARCRGGGAYLLAPPDHTILKEANDLWPILEDLLSSTRISAGADRCFNRFSSSPLSDLIAWVNPIAVRIKSTDFSACVICQRIGWVVEIDIEAEKITLSYIRASQGLLSYVKEIY